MHSSQAVTRTQLCSAWASPHTGAPTEGLLSEAINLPKRFSKIRQSQALAGNVRRVTRLTSERFASQAVCKFLQVSDDRWAVAGDARCCGTAGHGMSLLQVSALLSPIDHSARLVASRAATPGSGVTNSQPGLNPQWPLPAPVLSGAAVDGRRDASPSCGKGSCAATLLGCPSCSGTSGDQLSSSQPARWRSLRWSSATWHTRRRRHAGIGPSVRRQSPHRVQMSTLQR